VRTWENTYWLGKKVLKCPLDLWVYQEMLSENRPDLLIECGTAGGGSAAYFASLFDLLDHGRIVTIDIGQSETRREHERITYLTGSSVAPETLERGRPMIHPGDRVMVVLDSDHTRDHVLAELRAYKDLVSLGCYLVVEDSCINGHPVVPQYGPGPMEAIELFLQECDWFEIDREREKFFLTFKRSRRSADSGDA
jgi:cephalosporin hydroxylase